MATPTINNYSPQAACPNQQQAARQEEFAFLETTFRIAALMASVYYGVLAALAYPVLAPALIITGLTLTYSKLSGLSVRDLVDRFCMMCSCAQAGQAQPARRHVRAHRIPPTPGSDFGMLTIPVRFFRASSPESSPRSAAPQSGSSFQAEKKAWAQPASYEREFFVAGPFPDTKGYVPSSLLQSGVWTKK